jgi:hypothetical protein
MAMRIPTLLVPLFALPWLLSPSAALGEPLRGEATAIVSLLSSAWPQAFRNEWLGRERALDDEFRRKGDDAESEYRDDLAELRDELREDEDELRTELVDDLAELREEFKKKRSAILSSRDDADRKQAALDDLDDDFYDERDALEAENREEWSVLRREYDEKAAALSREKDQEMRRLMKGSREAIETLAEERKSALVRGMLNGLRVEALGEILRLQGVNPVGEPILAADLLERLGSGAVFTEVADEAEGASRVGLRVGVEVDSGRLAEVFAQWGILIPPSPIVIRFRGWNGDPRGAEESVRAAGYLDREYLISTEGTDLVVSGATYLSPERLSERLNRIRIWGGEVRSVVGEGGLTVAPFP